MSPASPKGTPRPLPQWGEIHRELRRKGVTLTLLSHEYEATHPEGVQYSEFCEQYRAFAATLDAEISTAKACAGLNPTCEPPDPNSVARSARAES